MTAVLRWTSFFCFAALATKAAFAGGPYTFTLSAWDDASVSASCIAESEYYGWYLTGASGVVAAPPISLGADVDNSDLVVQLSPTSSDWLEAPAPPTRPDLGGFLFASGGSEDPGNILTDINNSANDLHDGQFTSSGQPYYTFYNPPAGGSAYSTVWTQVWSAVSVEAYSDNDSGGSASAHNSVYATLYYTLSVTVYNWFGHDPSDYFDTSNWSAGVAPNGVDAVAMLGYQDSGRSDPQPATTVTLSSNLTLGTLLFDNPNTYTVNGPGTLTLEASTGDAQIILSQGDHVVNASTTLASNTDMTVAAGSLTFSSSISSASGTVLTTHGGGTLNFSGFSLGSFLGQGAEIDLQTGTYTAATLSNTGQLNFQGGTLTAAISNSGTFSAGGTVNGNLFNSGTATFGGSAAMNGNVTNLGTFNMNIAALNGSVCNYGSFVVNGSGGTSNINGNFINNGTVQLYDTSLNINGNFVNHSVVNNAPSVTGNVVNTGTMILGDYQFGNLCSPSGRIQVEPTWDGYWSWAGNNVTIGSNATLAFHIEWPQYLGGCNSLNGSNMTIESGAKLELDFDGYQPQNGDSFQLYTFDGLTGNFDPGNVTVNTPSPLSIDWEVIPQVWVGYVAFYIPGDINLDGTVDSTDLADLQDAIDDGIWSLSPSQYAAADFNNDGVVDEADYDALAAYLGESPSAIVAPEPTVSVAVIAPLFLARRRKTAGERRANQSEVSS